MRMDPERTRAHKRNRPGLGAAEMPLWRAAAGGLLVGVGVTLGNGCTSGHGICGNSRLSTRSMSYTLVFMAAGFLTGACLCACRDARTRARASILSSLGAVRIATGTHLSVCMRMCLHAYCMLYTYLNVRIRMHMDVQHRSPRADLR